MSNQNVSRLPAPALPPTVKDLLAQRKAMRTRSLNDDVEDCFLELWEDESFRSLLLAIWKEETVEGSFIADETVAAIKLRSYAVQRSMSLASTAKLAALMRSLRVVCRRYQIDRKFRRNQISRLPSHQKRVEEPHTQE
jgi:hypothetical protein